ncbi:ribosomal RNA processing protein 36 homolog [Microplitis demolitor]|uniref:ribosomal RNA processing protein 36 homolog n=1 Tax=Microplitis demolitor TaxID=69319 RepID=UPI0004CC9DB6|nr:ribosomal RNA processing protein 36 homolog [Microplitis demolitor]
MTSDTEETNLLEDNDQIQIRKELSHMSFEELHKLKDKVGAKIYNEALFGKKNPKKREFKKNTYRNLNDDRPVEVSAKKKVSRLMNVISVKKPTARDPRFDRLCGEFNEKAFKNSYSFVTKLKENDIKALKKELKSSQDPEEIKKIKYLIQRLENQLREEARKQKREESQQAEKKEIVEAIKKGEKPQFKKKSEKKIIDLVSQYEELKNSGKLKKHIQRLKKKRASKDRKKLTHENDDMDD